MAPLENENEMFTRNTIEEVSVWALDLGFATSWMDVGADGHVWHTSVRHSSRVCCTAVMSLSSEGSMCCIGMP